MASQNNPEVLVLALVGIRLRDPEDERPDRSARDAFGTWHRRLSTGLGPLSPGDRDGLVTRSLLDNHRSPGEFFTVGFSAGLLFAVSAFLVETVAPIVDTDPCVGVTFGALVGLSAFTTFNWLTNSTSQRSTAGCHWTLEPRSPRSSGCFCWPPCPSACCCSR
jgi:hypothetical protein